MSFCRVSDSSDIYVYQNFDDEYVCCMCRMSSLKNCAVCKLVADCDVSAEENHCAFNDVKFDNKEEMIAHINDHIERGHKVPNYAINNIKLEN